MASNEMTKIYEMVLSTPGMMDTIKVELKIPRKNVFLLAKAIDLGLSDKNLEDANSVLGIINKEVSDEIRNVSIELLQKAGLMDKFLLVFTWRPFLLPLEIAISKVFIRLIENGFTFSNNNNSIAKISYDEKISSLLFQIPALG